MSALDRLVIHRVWKPKAKKQIARIMRPGGQLVLACVNRFSIWGIPYIARCLRYNEKLLDPNTYNLLDLLQLLNANGFVIKSVKPAAKIL